ncbi:MAG: tetratricopeptide repeat protein [Candidatus Aminicenantes bacterium]|jgi:Tfp pilus assembly protein PilF
MYNNLIMKKQTYIYTVWICLFWTLVPVSHLKGAETDILKVRGIKVTDGAAPGYVPDRVCAMCHNTKYRSYQEVGMARSFYRPRADRFIEDFKQNHFYHEPSQRHYEISRQGDRLFFKRYQLDETGKPINVYTNKIDWIMGSGNHSRVYLYRTEVGELYQLPLAWYSQTKSWGMSPGFDRPDHFGVSRRVRRECMFCHNAYPDVPSASDAFYAPQVYPEKMPEGTGCQRCHGPGAQHVRIVMNGELEPGKIRAAIVNPKRLKPQLRDDVCFQCHYQPSVALFGIRRFDRSDYSFRPGQQLSDYLVHIDIKEEGKEQVERFEINHHPYRLMQSRCFKESNGTMSCLTCHNPHRKVPAKERAEHYRNACLKCHQVEHCSREKHAVKSTDPGDCASCHMPMRRTQDVVKVVMTDHLIQRRPASKEERFAPLKETVPIIIDAMFPDPAQAPPGALGEVYRVVAIFRAGGGAHVVDRLETMLDKAKPPELLPYFDLARGQLNYRRFADAENTLKFILSKDPDNSLAHEWMGITQLRLKQIDKAIENIRTSLKSDNPRAEAYYNLGRVLLGTKKPQEAVEHLKQALKIRHTLTPAWYHLGNAYAALNQVEKAIQSYKRALEISPAYTNAYLALGRILLKKGDRAEALRYWRHGVKIAANPKPITKALEQYSATQKK